MAITVRFFGELKTLGTSGEWTGVKTVADIVSRVPGLRLRPLNFLVFRNGVRCDVQTELEDGDNVRFFPMIMGG